MDSLQFVESITHTPTVPPTAPSNGTSPAVGHPRSASQTGLASNVQVAKVPKRSWSRDMLLGDAGVAELTNYLIHSRSNIDLFYIPKCLQTSTPSSKIFII